MEIFGKYNATDFTIGENTGGTDMDQHDTPPEREGGVKGDWVG